MFFLIARIFVAALPALLLAQVSIPAGTEMHVRLKQKISSDSSKTNQPVEGILITPVLVRGNVALPSNAKLQGRVLDAKPASKPEERALLHVVFYELSHGSASVPIKTRVLEVDNARETIDDAGRVVGILASETLAAQLDQGIEKLSKRNAGLAGVLDVARGVVLKDKPSGEIVYEPGVELKLRLLEPVRWEGETDGPQLVPPHDEAELYELVNAQPFQTIAEKPPKPSDITNLMFIGTEDQLTSAFKEAGWSIAHALNTVSVLETVRAIAEMRGYKEAPMSTLLLDGRQSDFDYQKGLNTFDKRHHLRIWRQQVTFGDKPVWVSSATHDIAIEFSHENRTFIHKIDTEIDKERAKVVSDLLFTGRVASIALVDRPAVPRRTRNATGDDIETDAKMAVIILKSL